MKTKLFLLLVLSVSAFGENLPPDVEALKAKRDAKIAEINQIYATALEKLLKKAMAEGNLDAANLIQKEIAEATPDPFVNPVKALIGKWDAEFVGSRVVQRSFTEDRLIDERNELHPYEVKGDTVTIDWGAGSWEKLKIDQSDPSKLVGSNSYGDKVIYRRVK